MPIWVQGFWHSSAGGREAAGGLHAPAQPWGAAQSHGEMLGARSQGQGEGLRGTHPPFVDAQL